VSFESGWTAVLADAKVAREAGYVPDTVALIIWIIAGVAGGNAAGELLKGNYDLGPGNTIAGAIGGVAGTLVLQTAIPTLSGFDFAPILAQVIVALASGALLTVFAAAVKARRRQSRQ
jgi:predicted CDP-diglyceride synthetase/phosphatidate cytidylyltransferase